MGHYTHVGSVGDELAQEDLLLRVKRIDDDVHQVTDSCESYFFSEPLAWMSSVEGKHNCPKCDAKICTLRWSGFKCSCGAWVAPGIQIPYSRVDGKYM